MSFESIIGIVGSLLTIALALGFKFDVLDIDVFNKRPAKDVFDKILDKKITDAQRKNLLKKLNKYQFFNKQIKKDYIHNFTLRKRGPEDLLFDICDSNNIEPTDDMSKSVLGYISNTLKTRFAEKRQSVEEKSMSMNVKPIELNNQEIIAPTSIKDQTVYLSELLKKKFPDTCNKLISILDKHNVEYSFLKATKDIWCRDYMPVQTPSGKLIQFTYNPSYLRGNKEWEDSRSDVKEVCRQNNIDAEFSDINLDGGNVLICDGRAIISDRIFPENPNRNKDDLIKELSKLLECEIIIIPAENDDMTGHADGMVRFVNRDTLLGNNRADEYKYWREGIQTAIDKYGLTYIDIPFFEPKDSKHPLSAVGIYVNYLEVNNLIVLPVFGRDEDKQAVDIIQNAFPERVVETIDYNEVAFEGGLFNCTTWVI